ncbi:sulfurtransferase [Microbacterium sp. KUDC0406]|uniref:sulfurtransferase n=1 Tax=Microbacterium sp. KUDC0406 TaxID=2909588 RepID=UPI002E337FA1|nr:rhodanese-like domain-containing protein [Microbacterium sp. KUDC0406]
MGTVIGAEELRALLDSGAEARVLDARWKLGRDDGREQYLAGHIPGAVYVDVEGELSRHGDPRDGRHPLPSDEAFAEAVRRWGVRAGVPVVVYDDAGMLASSRLWWALRRTGFADVRVLDGGWGAWLAAGGGVQTEEEPVEASDIRVDAAGAAGSIDTDSAATWPRGGVLVDVRAAERYRR